MTDEHEYYQAQDHGHDTQNEFSDAVIMCVLACVGIFSYLCYYLLEHVL